MYVHEGSSRQVFEVSLASATSALDLSFIAGRQFVCLLAMDATEVPAAEIGSLCVRLLDAGCAYLCTWGPDCARVHDVMDEEVVGCNPPVTDRGCVMTTWHPDDSLADALDFLLNSAQPDAQYAPKGCEIALVITVNCIGTAASD
jgi:hypothetical protein